MSLDCYNHRPNALRPDGGFEFKVGIRNFQRSWKGDNRKKAQVTIKARWSLRATLVVGPCGRLFGAYATFLSSGSIVEPRLRSSTWNKFLASTTCYRSRLSLPVDTWGHDIDGTKVSGVVSDRRPMIGKRPPMSASFLASRLPSFSKSVQLPLS